MRAMRLLLLGWHREHRPLREHLRGRPDRQHVLAPGLIEAIAQPRVLAVSVIAEHRRPREMPAVGALHQLDPELRLGLESDLLGDLRLPPPLLIRAPVLRQIQRPSQRHRPSPTDRVHRHADLTVTGLAQRPRVLALDTRRILAVLRKPRVIQHPRLDVDLRRDPLSDRPDDQRRIPRAVGKELLHRLVLSVAAQPLDDRLKRLASTLLQQPPQIQPAVDQLHRPVHRRGQHLARERLQTLLHRHRRPSIHRHHGHDASSRREPQTQEGFASRRPNPTPDLTKHYYNQWTQFEEFPKFMEGVEQVRQIDDRRLHWVAEFGGTRHEWDAEITEQLPDERIAWRNTDGKDNAGVVTFHKLDDQRSRVMVQMDFVPEGIKEKLGDVLGAPDRRVKGDLERFKQMIESRGYESGAWRGEVPRDS